MKIVKVKVGGKDYDLRSDNEALVRRCAEVVDRQYSELQAAMPMQSSSLIAVLTSLNLAEKSIELEDRLESGSHVLAAEIEKMTAYIRQQLDQ